MGGDVEVGLSGDETVRVLMNRNVTMSPGKFAAQAIHAVLVAYGIPHGTVIVLMASPDQVRAMPAVIADAGRTEIAPGTITAGARIERPS